jgi:anti-sigma-K factor RskA
VSDIDIHQLAAAYSLDALDDGERAAYEAHYPSCVVCAAEVGDFRETAAHLAEATRTTPPAALRDQVMAQISTTRQLSPTRDRPTDELSSRRRRHVQLLTAAAAVIVLAVTAFAIGRRTTGGNDYDVSAAAILARPDTRVMDLLGAGEGMFRVAWSPQEKRAVVTADGLDDPGTGRAYELWLIDDAGPHPVRLLDTATGGRVRRILATVGEPSQWAVTIEASAGADAPTGEILFASTV